MTSFGNPRIGAQVLTRSLIGSSGETVTRSSLNTSDDAVEQNGLLFTIPANLLVGYNAVRLHALGTCTNNASSTKIIAVRLGSTSMGNLANITTAPVWQIDITIYSDGSTNGQYCIGTPNAGFTAGSGGALSTNNQDGTQPIDLKIVWRWSAAAAGESIVLRNYFVELIPAP